MEEPAVGIGDLVRAKVEGMRAVIGRVTGESHAGRCWVVAGPRGEQSFHKVYCTRINSLAATRESRKLGKPTLEYLMRDWEI